MKKKKKKQGIIVVNKIISRVYLSQNQIKFSDGEEWIILSPNTSARGYRWRKAWIDVKSTTLYNLKTIILPIGDLYKWEDEKYFNW